MTTVPISPPNWFRRRWRLLLAVCVLAVAGFAAIVGWQMLRVQRARAELQQVLAELDRDEPGWRIGDLEAARATMHRSRHVKLAIHGLERLLGHLEIPESELETFQTKLFAESVHDPWPIGLRGERAWKHQAFDAAAHGILPYSELRRLAPSSLPAATWPDKARDWFADRLPTNLDVAHMRSLRRHTQLLRESGRISWHERSAQVAAFEADDTAVEFIPLGIGFAQILRQLQTGQARLQCAIVGTAAERFRLRQGRWPDSLPALVPDFLPAVAADPFDGQPLRYKRLADGVVIYTVGPDLADNGGNLARDFPGADGTDIGFRLWDVASRGQAPKPTPGAAP